MRIKWTAAMLLVPLMVCQGVAFAQVPQATSPLPEGKVSSALGQTVTPMQSSLPISPVENSDRIHLDIVNCGWWGDCLLARMVLPSSMQVNTYQLWFENDSSTSISVAKTALIARGQLTGYQLSEKDLRLKDQNQALLGNQITQLNMQVNRLEMPPDHYDGKFYLMLKDRRDRLMLPLMINVRTGPLLPIAALFAGVVLGRLLKYMQERGGPQSDKLKLINRLEADLNALHPDDQKILAPMLLSVRQLVFREELAQADTQISLLRGRLEVLQKLRRIQERLEADPAGNLQQFLPQVDKVRMFLSEAEDESAKRELEALQEDLAGMRGDATAANLETAVGNAAQRLDAKDGIEVISPKGLPGFHVRKSLIWLSGVSDELRAEATLWVVRPLLSIGLLVGLALMGMNELYIEKGATLGAKPFTDYWGLILWGLSADVASRSLSSLNEKPGT